MRGRPAHGRPCLFHQHPRPRPAPGTAWHRCPVQRRRQWAEGTIIDSGTMAELQGRASEAKPTPPPTATENIPLGKRRLSEPRGGTELWALHGATAHISTAKSSPDQREENPIYPIIKSPREKERERVQGNHLFCTLAQGLQPGITCPAKKPFKFCHRGDGPSFPLLGRFYPYPRERYCCNHAVLACGANLPPWAQSLQLGSQHMAGRQTRTQGLGCQWP